MDELFIGLMSGTSLDGVDAVLVDFGLLADGSVNVLATAYQPFDAGLTKELLALNSGGGVDELHRAALAGNALARIYAVATQALLAGSGTPARRVRAIGAHGQTVRHRPGEFDGIGYTVQLDSPALLAESTGIDVVADFRSRDVAARGQGAPLVPAFHRAVFGHGGAARAVLNLGGIANLTVLGDGESATLGFDCGPANLLMDHWCQRTKGTPFDAAGAWASSGQVIDPLLADLLSDPFFGARPPKSTGRDRFHADWLNQRLDAHPGVHPVDVQATLAELTAVSCADAVDRFAQGVDELLVCGGGALNEHLMRRLAALLPRVTVLPTDARGLPAMQVEACAFAWLARAFCRREPGNLTRVTGAIGPRVLGALYPAR